MGNVRITVKKGARDAVLLTFDPTYLPNNSLEGITVDWYCRRTLDGDVLITKSSSDSSQIEIVDPPTLCQVYVYLEPSDTENLVRGEYYWGAKLSGGSENILAISPPTVHGDMILLDSAVVP